MKYNTLNFKMRNVTSIKPYMEVDIIWLNTSLHIINKYDQKHVLGCRLQLSINQMCKRYQTNDIKQRGYRYHISIKLLSSFNVNGKQFYCVEITTLLSGATFFANVINFTCSTHFLIKVIIIFLHVVLQ